ncbi:MAG: twin-arginine translocation signal domain-containing protein, partial [Bryobacteraceae bacterium]
MDKQTPVTQTPSRRQFLSRTTLSAAAVSAFPLILPQGARGANDRVTVGVIGVGGRANLLIDQLPDPGR